MLMSQPQTPPRMKKNNQKFGPPLRHRPSEPQPFIAEIGDRGSEVWRRSVVLPLALCWLE